MKSQIIPLCSDLRVDDFRDLNEAGIAFYNAALSTVLESQESGRPLFYMNGCTLLEGFKRLCERAKIAPDALPNSVMDNLLAAVHANFYGKHHLGSRRAARFWPLTWSGDEIVLEGDTVLLRPHFRFKLPELDDPVGILSSITLYEDFSEVGKKPSLKARISWRPIPPHSGPGKAANRAFGYTKQRVSSERLLSCLPQGFRQMFRGS